MLSCISASHELTAWSLRLFKTLYQSILDGVICFFLIRKTDIDEIFSLLFMLHSLRGFSRRKKVEIYVLMVITL